MYREKYNVIVVGGGTGGFIAAVSAAREGASTLLIEQCGSLGGTATSCALSNLSSFYFQDEKVIDGLPQEFVDRLVAGGGATGHMRSLNGWGSGYYNCLYNRENFKYVAQSMVLEAGVDVLYHTFFSDVVKEGEKVVGVCVVNKSGTQTYFADVVIDATGDGDVAARAGAEYVLGTGEGAMQPGSLMFDMANVDVEALHSYVLDTLFDYDAKNEMIPLGPIPEGVQRRQFVVQGFYSLIRDKIRAKEVYSAKQGILFTTTAIPGVVNMNSTRLHFDPTDAEQRSLAELDGRKQAQSIADFLTHHIPGFEKSYMACSGMAGFRESRHIVGEYTLTAEDVYEGRHFPDVIARCGFPSDVHNVHQEGFDAQDEDQSNRTLEGLWIENKDVYDVPYRSLLPKRTDGLIVIGRCISSDHIAHGSTRLMPVIMAEGQAAGVAAKMAIDQGVEVRRVDIPALQKRLLSLGASLYRDPQAIAANKKLVRARIAEFLATDTSITTPDNVQYY